MNWKGLSYPCLDTEDVLSPWTPPSPCLRHWKGRQETGSGIAWYVLVAEESLTLHPPKRVSDSPLLLGFRIHVLEKKKLYKVVPNYRLPKCCSVLLWVQISAISSSPRVIQAWRCWRDLFSCLCVWPHLRGKHDAPDPDSSFCFIKPLTAFTGYLKTVGSYLD